MSAKKAPAKETAAQNVPTTVPTMVSATAPASEPLAPLHRASAAASQSETTSNKDLSGDTLSLSPRRLKIAELATQLVAAQITARASYEAAVDVATEQRKLVAEALATLAEILNPSPAPKQEPATDPEQEPATNPAPEAINAPEQEATTEPALWQILRDRLNYSTVRIRKPLELKALSSPELDQLFASAMHRAQKLLIAPELDLRTVWAEQIFEPEDILSENQIFETFRKYHWPNLTGRQSVVELMTYVDKWFSEHYSYLGRVDGVENKTSETEQVRDETELLVRVLDLFDDRAKDGFNRYRRDYKAVADEIKCFLRSRDTRILGTLSGAFWNIRAQNLIFMMYNQSVPLPRDSKPGDDSHAPNPRGATRMYRPWGIFRYLRLYAGKSGDKVGEAINSRIRTRALKLNPDLVANVLPVAPPDFEFGPIGTDMDDLLDSQEYEGTDLVNTPHNATYDDTDYDTDYDTDEDLPF